MIIEESVQWGLSWTMENTIAFLFFLPVMQTSENSIFRAIESRIPSQYVVSAPPATSAVTLGKILEM